MDVKSRVHRVYTSIYDANTRTMKRLADSQIPSAFSANATYLASPVQRAATSLTLGACAIASFQPRQVVATIIEPVSRLMGSHTVLLVVVLAALITSGQIALKVRSRLRHVAGRLANRRVIAEPLIGLGSSVGLYAGALRLLESYLMCPGSWAGQLLLDGVHAALGAVAGIIVVAFISWAMRPRTLAR